EEREEEDQPAETGQGGPAHHLLDRRLVRILEPGPEAGQAIPGERDLDSAGGPGRPRPARGVADGEVGAGGELLAADLHRAEGGEVDVASPQEGIGLFARRGG